MRRGTVMATTITLNTDGKSLRLTANDAGWCQVILEDGPRQIPLGADLLSIISERLSDAVASEPLGASVGSLEGREVWWVLSLSELHTSLYVTRPPGSLTLFVQNAEAEIIGVLTLTEVERQKWLASLAEKRQQMLVSAVK